MEHFAGLLLAEDFADPRAGATYRAAQRVHADSAVTGRRVDPVTLAWQQQRGAAQHGVGLGPDELIRITGFPAGAPGRNAELVMRGSLVRLTCAAADAAVQAARQFDLEPGQLLDVTRGAYETVTIAAERMAGHGAVTARLAGLAFPVSIDRALRRAAAGAGSAPAAGPELGRAGFRETATPGRSGVDTELRDSRFGARPSRPGRAGHEERGRG